MPVALYLSMIFQVALGTHAIAAPYAPLSYERATRYAVAATNHGLRAGVDPFELVALARNESDFQEHLRGPDGKDCGLTQTRTTITRYSCRELLRSYELAFQEAARELKEYNAACRDHDDYDRCRLNHYNSGVRYARHGFHGLYWMRIACFAEAAREGAPVGSACRHVRGRGDIRRTLTAATAAVTRRLAVADRPAPTPVEAPVDPADLPPADAPLAQRPAL